MHPILAYMEKRGIRWQKDFAALVGTTPATVNDLVLRRYRCSVDLGRQIEKAVDGEITAEQLVMIDPFPREKRKPARKKGKRNPQRRARAR